MEQNDVCALKNYFLCTGCSLVGEQVGTKIVEVDCMKSQSWIT